MKEIAVSIQGVDMDFEQARDVTRALVRDLSRDPALVAWYDRKLDRHSPSIDRDYECDSGGHAHWEKYGMSHGGRFRMVVNDGEYVMIYT